MAENQIEIKSENKDTVTKVKNPKNIEKGKKLAEWNKLNKNKIRSKKEETYSSNYFNYGAALTVTLLGAGAYYVYLVRNDKDVEKDVVNEEKPKVVVIPKNTSLMN